MNAPERKMAALFLSLLVAVSLFSDFLSSNSPREQNLGQFFQPPARVHLWQNGSLGRPYICRMEMKERLDARYQEDPSARYPLQFFFRSYEYRLLGLIPTNLHFAGRSEPPYFYPLGTDEFGRDVLARLLAGARTSMLIVIFGLLFYAVFGITIGAFAGILGGWVDSALMRFSEFVLALPALYIVVSIRAFLPMQTPFLKNTFLIVGTIAAVAWPPLARGVRGLILQLRNSGFVEAARSIGAPPNTIFRKHMLPSILPFVLSQLVVAAPIFLLGEVVLSFLNIGFRDSGDSWGSMLQILKQDTRVLTEYWWNLTPIAMVFMTLLCLNLVGERRVEDGRTREQALRL